MKNTETAYCSIHKNMMRFIIFIMSMNLIHAQSSSEIYKSIQKLNFLGSVLYVAAHPDDENTRMISYFSNHLLARTAYLSLTRGDGGQNLIGSELREALGLIRTQELLSARRIDGGEQYFTMASDFGYSKHPDETFSIWDKEEVLSQTIERIRQFKPDIIINRFDHRTPGKTHGHHTSSAIISTEAFELSGSKNTLSISEIWQPKRLFFNTSWWFYGSREKFNKSDRSNLIEFDSGVYDPLTGKSNSEIAAMSRSQHKSQGFGSAAQQGRQVEYLELIKGKPLNSNNPFEGINTSWTRLAGGAEIEKLIIDVINEFNFSKPYLSVSKLVLAHDKIKKLKNKHWSEIKSKEIEDVILRCLGVDLQANASVPYAIFGEEINIITKAVNPSPIKVIIKKLEKIKPTESIEKSLVQNLVFEKKLKHIIKGEISSPYWLSEESSTGMYSTSKKNLIGLAETPAAIVIDFTLLIEGVEIKATLPLSYRKTDPVRGEVVVPFQILPATTTQIEEPVYLFSGKEKKSINIKVKNNGASFEGNIHLKGNKHWKISPENHSIVIDGKGAEKNLSFEITPPDFPDQFELKPLIETSKNSFNASMQEIEYDHFPKQYMVVPAISKAITLDLKTDVNKIGYINGAGDKIPESLRAVGIEVEMLDADQISLEKLNNYASVVMGIRAFNVNESLSFKNKILWEYVAQGGTLLIQYNTSRGLKTNEIAPLNLRLSRDRVTDENAAVTILDGKHLLLNHPNKISSKDFEGWVQERGLYFPNQWHDDFKPLLRMNDPGENPKDGALLSADYGKGKIVYTGLSFFRLLPAGVPGAYRLFFNLIAPKNERK